ncbi:DNA-binding protein [Xylariomycetidae sp. FL0641]|nr:DNA-binding protein [Xylariomycetidae sp. FL0641]
MSPAPPPPSTGPSLPLPQASHLLTSFSHFLTVCIHNILYYRNLYPPSTFLTSRAYNLPVHQSRHPAVCAWVRDAVDAVRAQLSRGAVERIAVVLYSPGSRVLERWMFDVGGFPAWREAEKGKQPQRPRDWGHDDDDDVVVGGEEGAGAGAGDGDSNSKVNWANVDEQLRAAVRRLAYAGEKMAALPDGCTFTVAVELREEGDAPIGHPQPWVPTEPNLQTKSRDRDTPGEDVGGAKTTPLRAIEAGPLFFECWVEEGKAKAELTSPASSDE